MWKFTCFNGFVWFSNKSEHLDKAIKRFEKLTGLNDFDIKKILKID